jgi:hypothetical protein
MKFLRRIARLLRLARGSRATFARESAEVVSLEEVRARLTNFGRRR